MKDFKTLAEGVLLGIRKIDRSDLPRVSEFSYTVSIVEPLNDPDKLNERYAETGLWEDDSGAIAIIENGTGRLIGTAQYYRSAPCIHGIELGYIIHDAADRGKGYASEAVRLFSDYLFKLRKHDFRQQLIIEVENTASWKVAERCGFLREGVLRRAGFDRDNPADCFVYSRTKKD